MSTEYDPMYLAKYDQYVDNQESPSVFHLWVALTTISAAVARNIWIERAYHKVYPNIYTILVAGSGACRKSTAIRMGSAILKEAYAQRDDRVIMRDKLTPQALMQVLGEKTAEDNSVPQHGVIDLKFASPPTFLLGSELGVFLSKDAQQSGMVDTLTDLYDCPDDYEYTTKNSGSDVMIDVALTMLSATTPVWMENNIIPRIFGEGFIGRTFFVYANKPKKLVAFPQKSAEEEKLKTILANQLREISHVRGAFTLDPNALKFYEAWYEEKAQQKMALAEDEMHSSVEMLSGFAEREADHVLKISMLLAVSQGGALDMTIYEEHLATAIKMVNDLKGGMNLCLGVLQVDTTLQDTTRVLNYVKKRATPITRRSILNAVSRYMGTIHLDECLQNLLDRGLIKPTEVTEDRNTMMYEYIGTDKEARSR
jgi:hypothetical protein